MGLMCRSPRETLLREIRQKKKSENDYMIMPDAQKKKIDQIWIRCQNSLTRELKISVVGCLKSY